MGVDVTIWVSTLDGDLPSGLHGIDRYLQIHEIYPAKSENFEGLEGANWEFRYLDRYYGPGYPRGSWGRIRDTLRLLLADPWVTGVWYGRDDGGRVIDSIYQRVDYEMIKTIDRLEGNYGD